MDTTPATTPAPETKVRKIRSDAGRPKFEYYLSKDGIPCRAEEFPAVIKGHIFVPCKPGEALDLIGSGKSARRKAATAIKRSEKKRNAFVVAMNNTLFTHTAEMKRAYRLLVSGAYTLEKRTIKYDDTPCSTG